MKNRPKVSNKNERRRHKVEMDSVHQVNLEKMK